MIPLRKGAVSDVGYRFRRNTFSKLDYWYPAETTENQFFDITSFNSDTFWGTNFESHIA